MNDERAALVNSVLEGRLTVDHGIALLNELLFLEESERSVPDPSGRLPPWRESREDITLLLLAKDCAALLPTCTARIANALEAGLMDELAHYFAALEVVYLADFWSRMGDSRFTCGEMVLTERKDGIHRDWVTIAVAADSWALRTFDPSSRPWLTSHAFPVRPTTEPIVWPPEDDDEIQVKTWAEAAADPVVTPLGEFRGCLKATRHSSRPWGREGRRSSEERKPVGALSVWFAPGVGPVRFQAETFEEEPKTLELSDYSVTAGDGFFPRSPNNWWRFETLGNGRIRTELWRLLGHPARDSVWLINSAFEGPVERSA